MLLTRRLPRLLPFAFAAVLAPTALACTASTDDSAVEADEQALTEAKPLAKGIANPSALAKIGDQVYFGSNTFVASGDIELDQQFAYWTGTFHRVGIGGGRATKVAEIGPVQTVRAVGSRVLYNMGGGCWISQVETSGGASSSVWTLPECEPESGTSILGFDITKSGKLLAVSDDAVWIGKPSGQDMKKLAELRIGDWGSTIEAYALTEDAVYLVTPPYLRTGNHDLPQAIHRVDLATGTITKLLDLAARPDNFTSDGKNLFWSEGGTKVVLLAAGATAPKTIAQNLGQIITLASDGSRVFVADGKRDAIYVVADALTAPKRQRKLAVVKGLTTMALTDAGLLFGSHAVENRKPAGIIGLVPIAQ